MNKISFKLNLAKIISSSFFKYIKFNKNLRILMYHSLRENAYLDKKNLYKIEFNEFKKQLSYLISNNYTFSSLNYLKYKNKEISITFDDGYESIYSILTPLLVNKNIPFTIFVTPKFVKSNESRFINKKQLFELSSLGNIEIGAHGYNHLNLVNLSQDKLINEVFDSKKFIEDVIGKKVNYFSYPYGQTNKSIIKIIKKAKYKAAFTSRIGTLKKNDNKFLLNRTDILAYDNLISFKEKINGCWDWTRYVK